MGARNRERQLAAAEFGEHLCTVPDGQLALPRRRVLGVVVENGRRYDHDVGIAFGDVVGAMADVYVDAGLLELLGVAALLEVGSGHPHALVVGDPCDAAHADAADPYEVN